MNATRPIPAAVPAMAIPAPSMTFWSTILSVVDDDDDDDGGVFCKDEDDWVLCGTKAYPDANGMVDARMAETIVIDFIV